MKMDKELKKKLRKELMQLLNEYPDWMEDETSPIYSEIQALGEVLSEERSKNIYLSLDNFTDEQYLYLLNIGLTNLQIQKSLYFDPSEFIEWRKQNGYWRTKDNE